MKGIGCSMIIVNSRQQVLLLLRDSKSEIPYPACWDLPGGKVEPGESPEQAILREVKEELGLEIKNCSLFRITDFHDRKEYTFRSELDLEVNHIDLQEGQAARWFQHKEIAQIELAFNFNVILEEFFKKRIEYDSRDKSCSNH
ncbi:MAG: NUDIX hydrolase [Candidatus Cloacimonetes bacterium]|nr:NUDIX hydrolase [Candidatus Cloacimonadota bacterium]